MDYEIKLVAGHLLLVSTKLTAQDKDRVLNSVRFTQLYANAEAERFSEVSLWSSCTLKAFQICGWSTSYSRNIEVNVCANEYGSVPSFILDHLAVSEASLTPDQVVAVSTALYSLEHHANACDWLKGTVFKETLSESPEGSRPITTMSLQISVIEPRNQLINFSVSCALYSASSPSMLSRPILGSDTEKKVTLSAVRAELDFVTYESVKGNIIDALGTDSKHPWLEIKVLVPTAMPTRYPESIKPCATAGVSSADTPIKSVQRKGSSV